MAEVNLGSDVNFDFLKEINLPDDVKNKIAEQVSNKVKAAQAGMTKAQQEAAQLRQAKQAADTELQKWNAWYTPNKAVLDEWENLGPLLHKHGAAKARQMLAADESQTVSPQQVQAVRDNILKKYGDKELSYEEMQTALRDVDTYVENVRGDVSRLNQRIDTELLPQINQRNERYGQQLGAVNQELMKLKNGFYQLFPLTIEAITYQREHPDRDVREVLKVANENNITNWNDAVRATYGEADFNQLVDQKVQEKLAIEQENLKRKFEANGETGEGGMSSTPIGMWRRKKVEQPVPTSDAAVRGRLAEVLSRNT